MIGIYKITNKLNGKSYIGQSIHCIKRLSEHYRGENQFIDQIIKIDGINNFTFEILKECDEKELSYWEDYFIIKYNTYFPSGYNKKWNTPTEIRTIIKKSLLQEMTNEKEKLCNSVSVFNKFKNNNIDINRNKTLREKNMCFVHTVNINNYKDYKKITNNQWLVYYYLSLVSNSGQDYNYINKKNINITKICKEIGINSTKTFYNALNNLEKFELIKQNNNEIFLYFQESLYINKQKLLQILKYKIDNKIDADLLRTYLILKEIKELKTIENSNFSIRKIVLMLGHSDTDTTYYNKIKRYLEILEELNLIVLDSYIEKQNNLGQYTIYRLLEVY